MIITNFLNYNNAGTDFCVGESR